MNSDHIALYRDWLEKQVDQNMDIEPEYDAKGNLKVNINVQLLTRQLDDLAWQALGNPAPTCGWDKPFRKHPADCNTCRVNRIRIQKAIQNAKNGEAATGASKTQINRALAVKKPRKKAY